MLSNKTISLIVLLGASLVISACGGGGGSSDGTGGNNNDTTNPVSNNGDAISIGAVTQLGSIYVNGVRYDTSSSSVTFDGSSGSESSIRVGQTVIVNGSINSDGVNGTANTVAVRSVVKGPVAANNYASNQTLMVLGQTVQITGQTIKHNISDINNIGIGTDVEVHGHVRGSGLIEATYIETKTLTEFKVVGLAENISVNSFTIGDLTIETSSATVSGLTDNALVEVKGSKPLNEDNSLSATKIESASLSQSSASKVEIEGFVTSFTNSSDFSVGTQPVTTSNRTRFDGGLPEEIGLASKLEVEGQLVDGVLQASKVSFRYNIKIEGTVATSSINLLTIAGLDGVEVVIDELTESDFVSPDPGDYMRIRGYKTSANTVTAIRIDSRSSDTRLILQGPVEAEMPDSSITIMGFAINTGEITQFRDTSDSSITRSNFHDQIDINSIVKVRGDYDFESLVWNEAEIEYK